MAARKNELPPYTDLLPYTDEPPKSTNPYHTGYIQHGDQGYVAAPQGAMVMQQTVPMGPSLPSNTVVVTGQPQPTIVINQFRGSDLTLPAFLVCFFCCWCTGIPAIMYACKARNEYDAGNFQEGHRSNRTARGWIIGSVVTHLVIWAIIAVFYLTVIAIAINKAESAFDKLGSTTVNYYN